MCRSVASVGISILLLGLFASGASGGNSDCNLNGRDDAGEIASGDAKDCNGDGVPDDCEVAALLTGGSRELIVEEPSTALAAADVNGDGFLDLISLGRGGALSVRTGGGDGTFAVDDEVVPGCADATALVSGDFDDDGVAEIAIGCAAASEAIVISPLEAVERISLRLDDSPTALATGDLDLDGRLDIVAASERRLFLLRNRADGTFAVEDLTDAIGTSEPDGMNVADLDGDRFPDVVLTDPGSDTVSILYGTGGPAFGEVISVTVGGGPAGIVSLDMDLDGDLDLVTVNRGSRNVTRLEQVTRGEFALSPIATPFDEPFEALGVTVGEMNGDPRPDLAVGGIFLSTSGTRHWNVRALVGLPRGGFTLAEDYFAGEIGAGLEGAPILIAGFDTEDLPYVVTPITDSRRLAVFTLETEGGNDDNGDGIPDDCGERRFRRGDVDADGALVISDAVRILRHLLAGSVQLPCVRSGDADDNGLLQVTDAVWLLRYLFQRGAAPSPPFPDCGNDPTADPLPCLAYPLCEA